MSDAPLIIRGDKGRRLKRIGCALLFFLSPLFVAYAIILLYTYQGGSWAAQSVVPPIPQNSRLIASKSFNDIEYDGRIDFYTTSLTVTEVRDWFDSFVRMVPDELSTEAYSGNHFYSDVWSFNFSTEFLFYYMAGNVTRRTEKSSKYDLMPECFMVDIVAPDALNESPFLDQLQEIDSLKNANETVFVVKTCWPSW